MTEETIKKIEIEQKELVSDFHKFFADHKSSILPDRIKMKLLFLELSKMLTTSDHTPQGCGVPSN
jgi:hypothetical protein